jgi:hypothetical protein
MAVALFRSRRPSAPPRVLSRQQQLAVGLLTPHGCATLHACTLVLSLCLLGWEYGSHEPGAVGPLLPQLSSWVLVAQCVYCALAAGVEVAFARDAGRPAAGLAAGAGASEWPPARGVVRWLPTADAVGSTASYAAFTGVPLRGRTERGMRLRDRAFTLVCAIGVCVCVCLCVCVCVCLFVCVSVCVCMYVCVCACVYMCVWQW